MTMDELRAFVQASSWKFAKSMPQTPHEYTLRREAKDEDLFERVVLHIRQVGYHKKWGKTTYTYLDIDGWQYWTMGAPLAATILINRAKLHCDLAGSSATSASSTT
jgi:GH25 family lysozyme M1 (1,4-beta-N-acetylmuramidase)